MEIKDLAQKIQSTVGKYKFAVIVLIVGVLLLLLPSRTSQTKQQVAQNAVEPTVQALDVVALGEILQSVQGAGKVRVLLSVSSGERTVYQVDKDETNGKEEGRTQIETVIVTDSQRNETGLIQQINPPTYLGAIVVCEGADDPVVKLEITQAVAKITGLSTDGICVLKMK